MRLRQKNAVAKAMGDLFLDKGKIIKDHIEFQKEENDKGIRYGHILNFFGSWERMINHMRKYTPEVFEMIEQADKPPVEEIKKPEVKKEPIVAPKPSKPEVKVEASEEKDG